MLAACATVSDGGANPGGDYLSGRLSVQIEAAGTAPARAFSAAFDLRGSPDAGRLDLSTPLGSVLAQARWARGQVVLTTPQGERRFADLDELTRDMLGESVPVIALFDWLHGRPWAGAPSNPIAGAPAAAGNGAMETGFEQLGWVVSLARFDEALVSARRASPPVVSVRIKLERP